ncbi:MAG: helix-turn-helix transcriptional regulator [Erysipelotrichales bacterium]|nr:helix-turn-helix transcriptional regulator [Erysipelotrichales bacterium]
MTEFVPMFAVFYDQTFMMIPSFKTIILVVSALCITYLYNSIVYNKTVKQLYIPIIFMLLVFLFIPIYPGNEIKVFTYYTVYQVFTLWIGFSLYNYYKNHESEYRDRMKLVKRLAVLTIVFSLLIIVEDFVVIFFFDNYSPETLHIQNRCYSEDIYRITLAYHAIYYLISKIQPHLLKDSYEFDDPNLLNNEINTEETSKITVDINEININKFDNFCNYYDFTSREKEILKLIIAYKSSSEISDELFIAQGTVKTHMHKIYQKVNVTKRSQLIALYNEFSTNQDLG